MTKQEFIRDFYCSFEIKKQDDNTLLVISKAIGRNDDQIVDSVKTSIDIHKTNNWISDSQTPISVNEWNWDKLLEETKRIQLDYFTQRAPIEDFFPLDIQKNQDISEFYQKEI